jgi:hypothetical protein
MNFFALALVIVVFAMAALVGYYLLLRYCGRTYYESSDVNTSNSG